MKGKAGKLFICELILCYMVGLVIISYARGPEKYRRDPSGPKWTASDFSCFDDTGQSQVLKDVLHVENITPGRNIAFQTEVELTGVDGFGISFLIDCPLEYQGTHLAVDLYNEAAGYDEGSVEYMHMLSEGENKISCELVPGEGAPNTASLRIFTADVVNYNIRELRIDTLQKTAKVSAGMWAALLFAVAATAITWAVAWKQRKAE